MTEETTTTTRREMLGAVTAGAVAVGAGAVIAAPANAQRAMAMNANAKAVLPSGKVVSRAEVLATLGLDPTTPPDAWLTIAVCGSNASALKTDQLRTLVQSGKLNVNQLDAASRAKLGR